MEEFRIVLIGYRGTGKSSVCKELAKETGRKHYDTDQKIEEISGRSIPEIFQKDGEEKFRDIEKNIIAAIPPDVGIVSCGGGAVLRSENIKNLRRKSIVFLLLADPDTIYQRIESSDRPPLTSLPLREEIKNILIERLPIYRSAADIEIDTNDITPQTSSEMILNIIKTGFGDKRERSSLTIDIQKLNIPIEEKDQLKRFKEPLAGPLYGILGYPCLHSKSPPIWNQLFQEYKIPAHYSWFETLDPEQFLKRAEISGIRGLSVTIPYKEQILPMLDEVRPDASSIGAVNTVLLQGGKKYGFNTDWRGIYRPLEGAEGDTAVILGAGGGAAAAVYAVTMRGFTPVILNRTEARAASLAKRYGAESGSLDKISKFRPDLLINATSIGMGNPDAMPIPKDALKPGMRVFDLVYTPADTALLRAALARGCYVIPGTEMFIHQLIEQFKILMGIDVPTAKVRELVM